MHENRINIAKKYHTMLISRSKSQHTVLLTLIKCTNLYEHSFPFCTTVQYFECCRLG